MLVTALNLTINIDRNGEKDLRKQDVKPEDLKRLGKFIANRRKKMRLTQQELAERVYVSKSCIGKWEAGGGKPSRVNMNNLAKELKVNVNNLYKFIESEEEETEYEVNITREIIAVLETYGYTVIPPKENR